MATHATRAGARKPSSKPSAATRPSSDAASGRATEGSATTETPSLDATLDAWSTQTSREQLALEIATCSTLLHGARAVREAQMQAAEQAEKVYLQAAERLLTARSLQDLAGIQFELLKTDAESAVQYWSRLGELAARNAMDTFQEAAAGWVRLGSTAMAGFTEWTRLQSSLPQGVEIVEAEVEHLTNPLAASPMVWPAQEATRQAMTLASSSWNDWMSWTSRLANGATRPH